MLIEQIIGTAGALLIEGPFRFGSAEPGSVGVGLFGRLFTLAPLLKSLEVDYFPHPALLSGKWDIRGIFTKA
jgi:hypothetical protein